MIQYYFMKKQSVLLVFLVSNFFVLFNQLNAQVSKEAFVPCQEMPNLIQNFNADNKVLNRYYSPATNNRAGGFGADVTIGSPKKNKRLQELMKEYLQKLSALNFNSLSQECKVDYILFKRDLNEKMRLLEKEAADVEKINEWIPFAPSIYAIEEKRQRGLPLDGEAVAK